MHGPNPNPEPETTILHLHKLVQGTPPPASPEDSVRSFIAQTAAETVGQGDSPVVVEPDTGARPPQSMLGVVSYCYTKGVYGSEDIGRKMAENPAVNAASYGDIPRPREIQRFRQLNREVIRVSVEKAMRFARHKIVESISPSNPFRRDASPEVPREDTEVFARREASERLDKAGYIDGLSM